MSSSLLRASAIFSLEVQDLSSSNDQQLFFRYTEDGNRKMGTLTLGHHASSCRLSSIAIDR